MRPDVLYIGPDKAGSTWLWQAFRHHPQIFVPSAKDLYFFDRFYERGMAWYEGHFQHATSAHRVRAEICHDYLYSPLAGERIAADLPKVRLFVNLRNPLDRTLSGYQNMVRNGETNEPVDVVLHSVPELVDRSRYARHLRPFRERFGERLGIFEFDDLEADPQRYFDDVCDWLGVDRLALTEEQLAPARAAEAPRSRNVARVVRGAGKAARAVGGAGLVGRIKHAPLVNSIIYRPLGADERPSLSPALRAWLVEQLWDDVRELSELTGTDHLTRWGIR